jgi:hypothetical protein
MEDLPRSIVEGIRGFAEGRKLVLNKSGRRGEEKVEPVGNRESLRRREEDIIVFFIPKSRSVPRTHYTGRNKNS